MNEQLTITEQAVLQVAIAHLQEDLEDMLECITDDKELEIFRDRYHSLLSLKIKLGIDSF